MTQTKKQILIAGCGDLGISLGQQLIAQGHAVTGLRRSADQLPDNFYRLAADLTDPEQLGTLGEKVYDIVVITMTPTEYSMAGYQQAYIDNIKNLFVAIELASDALVLFASSTGVFDQSDGRWVDEGSPVAPERYSGKIMLQAEQQIQALPVTAVSVRFGGIYGGERNRFVKQVKAGAQWPQQPHYTNRIHRQDCVAVFNYLIAAHCQGRALASCYVAVDDEPALLSEVMQWLRDQLGISQGASDTVLRRSGSKRCSNQRLRQLGYEFIYPSYREGYRALIDSTATSDLSRQQS